MNTGIIIMGAILIAICVIPIILMNKSRANKGRRILESITNYAAQFNCTITEHEFCGDFIIGIDKEKRVAFFIKQVDENSAMQHIELAEVKSCKIVNYGRTVKGNGSSTKVIDRLALNFILPESKGQNMEWELYNSEKSPQLTGELQAIEKWQAIIDEQILKKK
ncbi:MAG: hypothetical protein R2757_19625 [Draconibacterium sp.]